MATEDLQIERLRSSLSEFGLKLSQATKNQPDVSSWIWTWFPSAELFATLPKPLSFEGLLLQRSTECRLVYAIWQLEQCSTTGRVHFQGFFKFSRSIRRTALSDACTAAGYPGIHLEAVRSSEQACIKYCSKDDTRLDGPWEFGDRPADASAKRSAKLSELYASIDSGVSSLEMFKNRRFSSQAQYRLIRDYEFVTRKPQRDSTVAPNVVVYFGPSGSGKSRRVFGEFPDAYRFIPCGDKSVQWFDGYSGERVVIIDDLKDHAIPYLYLLQLLDRYPMQVQVKGSMVPLLATEWHITSAMTPEEWFPLQEVDELYRRITRVIKCEQLNDVKNHVQQVRDMFGTKVQEVRDQRYVTH